jgi:hypothetical protein
VRASKARAIVAKIARDQGAPSAALVVLEEALARSPLANLEGYLARIITFQVTGEWHITTLPPFTRADWFATRGRSTHKTVSSSS